jgi:hypothetical protein
MAISLGRNFDITGVDLADLSEVSAGLQIPGVKFVGNTDLVHLPFPDGTFDGVTSQFGMEYADIAMATSQAVRVMAPGGKGLLVMHHATGAITLSGARRLKAFHSVFTDDSAFQSGRTVFELYQRSAPAASIAGAEAAFQAAIGTLRSRLRNEPPFGKARMFTASLVNLAIAPGNHAPADALRQIDDIEGRTRGFVLRTQAQIDSALDRKGIDKVAGCLVSAGAAVDAPRELKLATGEAMAWSLPFSK